MSVVNTIKDRINIVDLINQVGGAELYKNGTGYVGWHKAHESQHHRSLHVDPEKGLWHCFNCKQGGDIFTWLGHQRFGAAYSDQDGHMFREVLVEAAEHAGVPLSDVQPELIVERRHLEEIFSLAADFYHSKLPDHQREYLRLHYGLTDETIDHLKIGFAPVNNTALVTHLVAQGVHGEDIVKTGLVFRWKDGSIVDFFQGRLIFPYWSGNRVVYFIGRHTEFTPSDDWERGKYKKQLVHNEKHPYVSSQVCNSFFYGEDSIHGAETIVVTEGVTDCIAAIQGGFPCVSPVTVQFRQADHPKLIDLTKRASAIYIVNDSETSEAGIKGALATAEALWRVGKIARLVQLPRPVGATKVDLNEFLRDFGVEAFQVLLSQAKTLLDLRIDDVILTSHEAKIKAMRRVFELLAYINDQFLLTNWRNEVSKRLGISKPEWDGYLKAARREHDTVSQNERENLSEQAIVVNDRQLRDILSDTLAAICRRNEHVPSTPILYVRNGVLVRVLSESIGLQPVETRALLGILSKVGNWITITKDDAGTTRIQQTWPPRQVVEALAAQGSWPGLPELDGIVHAPVFDSQGQLHTEQGFNPLTQLFYINDSLDLGDTTPTPERVAWAKKMILADLLGDFPFKDDASRAHALALTLLPFVRKLIDGPTPLHLTDSPTPGTGKGLLTDACALPFLGTDVACIQAGNDDDEWRKRLTAILHAGHSHVSIDNVRGALDTGVLASALTQGWLEDRILGTSLTVRMKVQAVWCANGNNVLPSDEIARRTVWIRLDANMERPWERSGFQHKNLRAWAKQHRGELVTAILIIVRAWIDAGMPAGNYTKGSYDRWAQVIGGILDTVGIIGFLTNERELFEAAVDSGAQWKAFIEAWLETYGTAVVSAGELFRLASHADDAMADGTYRGLLDDILGAGNERSRQIKLGKALSAQRDKTVGEFKIVKGSIQRGQPMWQLVNIASTFTTGQNSRSPEVVPRTGTPVASDVVNVVNVISSTPNAGEKIHSSTRHDSDIQLCSPPMSVVPEHSPHPPHSPIFKNDNHMMSTSVVAYDGRVVLLSEVEQLENAAQAEGLLYRSTPVDGGWRFEIVK